MANDLIKFNVNLPAYYDRWIRVWAFIKGVPRATLAANILQNRIESNIGLMKEQLQDIAKREGYDSIDMLLDEILNSKD